MIPNRYNMRSDYSPGSLTRLLIRAFFDVEKPRSFSDLAALTAESENKKRLFNVREGSDYRLPS